MEMAEIGNKPISKERGNYVAVGEKWWQTDRFDLLGSSPERLNRACGGTPWNTSVKGGVTRTPGVDLTDLDVPLMDGPVLWGKSSVRFWDSKYKFNHPVT